MYAGRCKLAMEGKSCAGKSLMATEGGAREAERYTRAFDRKKAAARAQAKIASANNVVPLAVAAKR